MIDHVGAAQPNAGLDAHLLVCSSCKAEVQMLRDLSAVLRPESEVPEQLVQRVMASVDLPTPSPEKNRVPVSQVLGSGVLGWLTALGVLVITGSAGAGGPAPVLLFSFAVGVTATGVQILGGAKAGDR